MDIMIFVCGGEGFWNAGEGGRELEVWVTFRSVLAPVGFKTGLRVLIRFYCKGDLRELLEGEKLICQREKN